MFKFKTKNTGPVTYQALCIADAKDLFPGAIIEIGKETMLLIHAVETHEDGSTTLTDEVLVDGGSVASGTSTWGPGSKFTVFKKM